MMLINSINRGKQKKIRLQETSRMPMPKSTKNKPLIIGFLDQAYGPVVTNRFGGLKGTGVPLALKKRDADQPIRKRPLSMNGLESHMFQGG